MTPTEQAADRVKALVDRLRGRPYVRTADASERLMVGAADALTALQARVGELEGALKPLLICLDDIETYQRRPERGSYDAECACCMGEMFEPEEYAAMEKARALLTPPLEQE